MEFSYQSDTVSRRLEGNGRRDKSGIRKRVVNICTSIEKIKKNQLVWTYSLAYYSLEITWSMLVPRVTYFFFF